MEIIIGFIIGLIFLISIFIPYIFLPLGEYAKLPNENYVNESTHTLPQENIATALNAPVPPDTTNPVAGDMVILPNGEQVPKSVITGYEQMCNSKKLNVTYYMTRNQSSLGLPSKQIIMEPGIAYDPIRQDCVYPIQTYSPNTNTWISKNMRIPTKYVQNMKLK
jgi:hypothetical protein